ncbi:MAG: Ger(x)C family spore germination protein [Clostridia bacterium]|jgi:Ger(x)C family germination protein|nr:Ger(x)C family spore germination protein [Clostridia bacterium]
MGKFKGLLFLILPFILTGCWDSVELNERHVILELAIDKAPMPDLSKPINERPVYKITYGIPDIGKLSGADSLAENVKTTITTQSPSIATSIDEVETKTQNTITFSHAKALILGEEVLKDKELFQTALDSLLRDMRVGRSITVLATKGSAGELTQADNPQNPIMGMYVMKYFNNKERPVSYAKGQLLGNFTKELEDTGVSTMPIISSNEEGIIEISGAALIKDYEFVAWLDKNEVRGELFVEGKIKGVPIIIDYKDQHLTYMIKEQQSKIHFKENNGKYESTIDLTIKGDITEYLSSENKNIFNGESIKEITKLLEEEINRQASVAVDKSKSLGIDFLGIGLEMYRKEPKQWEIYKSEWNKGAYKDFLIHVDSTVNIQNTGILE